MSTINFRLIFDGLSSNADLKKLLLYFQKDLGLPSNEIKSILASSPHVLHDFTSQHAAELSKATLAKMHCLSHLELVITYPFLNFAILQKHDRIIKKELSKVLRCRTNLQLLFIQIEPGSSAVNLPPIMGIFEDQLAQHFRESDTVIGIDDTRILILGFAMDKAGVGMLQNKAYRVIKYLLGDEVVIHSGYSIYPEDAQTIEKLLYLASIPGKDVIAGQSLNNTSQKFTPSFSIEISEQKNNQTPLQLCFTKARGKIFKRLLNMDSNALCLGLGQIPETQQRKFLYRLPFDFPLRPVLEEYISDRADLISDPQAESHFNAIINQMDLKEGIANRNELQDKILFRLSQIGDLPTLPSIAMEIFNIASNPDSAGTELVDIIRQDPALTSKILKTVNSAFYGNPQTISSVKQAVVLLGHEEVIDLAFGLAVAKVFDIKPLQSIIDPTFLWHHAVCTALIAQHLCRDIPQYKNISVFTAGLLHDIGKIFLMEKFADIYRQTYADTTKYDMPLFELEEDYLGMNHAIIGQHLSSNWNLPEYLVQAISHHHQPTNATATDYS
ncbi:MAG: HDOD domain-containing protein, partial [Smithella sp.]